MGPQLPFPGQQQFPQSFGGQQVFQPPQESFPQQGANPAALAIIGAALVQHAHQQAVAQSQAGQHGLHLGLNHQPGVAPGLAHAPGLQRPGAPTGQGPQPQPQLNGFPGPVPPSPRPPLRPYPGAF